MSQEPPLAAVAESILLAEDSAVQAKSLAHLLRTHGYRVTWAPDGAQALAAARAERPALLISDVRMPALGGYELCAAVKADPALRDTPVMLLTSLSDPHDILRGLQAGADNYLTKPYDEGYLLGQVRHLLDSYQRRSREPDCEPTVVLDGAVYTIGAGRQQIVDLLFSVFAAAVQRNQDLRRAQDELRGLNDTLEEKVRERTHALTAEMLAHKRAQVALGASEERLRLLFESSPDAIIMVDGAGRVTLWNPAAERLLGWSAKEVVGHDIGRLLVPPEHEQAFRAGFAAFQRTGAGALLGTPHEVEAMTRSGARVPVELSLSATRLGDRWHATGFLRDIADRQRAEHVNRQLLTAMEATSEVVVMTDPQGTIRYVNRAFEERTGYSAVEAIGQTPRLLKSGAQDPEVYADLWRTITGGRLWRGQLVNRCADGTTYTARVTIAPILGPDGRIAEYVAIEQDVTEELELQARLARSETLQAIGHLTAGISHDFNNLLQAVLSFSEFARISLRDGEPAHEYLVEIQRVVTRAANLVRQLLLFSRQQVAEPELLDLNSVVSDITKLLQRTIGEDVELAVELGPGLPPILASRVEVQQVLMNLAVNARDAMPTGGTLRIATQYATGAAAEVHLAVSDTGCGMSEEVRAHIFEAYYTTKGDRGGTGLGLATVCGVVEHAGGRIAVDSAPGRGTRFDLFFPAQTSATATAAGPPASGGEPAVATGTGETILVVEDDEMIRRLLQRVLGAHGYRVLAATRGAAAADLLSNHAGPLHLLITDVIMPVMSGPQLADLLRAQQPALKVVFMSGYPGDRLADHGVEPGSAEFLAKPFTTNEVLAKVRAVLAG